MEAAAEINFDGLVGPTFNHAGAAFGNLASSEHSGQVSKPKEAALQGLEKMRTLHDLGVPQAVLPPHFRPDLGLAKKLGFSGSPESILTSMLAEAPTLLAACYSSSAMWTANAATVCPSADALDRKVHFTPANLLSQLHRSIEAPFTTRVLRSIFSSDGFTIHEPLPQNAALGDEGAANHTRFCQSPDKPGLHFFVYGHEATNPKGPRPDRFPARQSLEASQAVARLHRLPEEQTLFAQQNPEAIDLGVFHNDVISVGNERFFFYHEEAFFDPSTPQQLADKFRALHQGELELFEVNSSEVSVQDCVSTYLFNSQIVQASQGTTMVCPSECEKHPAVHRLLQRLKEDESCSIRHLVFRTLSQSMHGGGGPACLRLRVSLTQAEQAMLPYTIQFSPRLHQDLQQWVEKHYRETLHPNDLVDPQLMSECESALDDLTSILGLGSIYDFQRG